MKKCKNCIFWNMWEFDHNWGGCKILNDRKLIYPEVEDCMDVCERTNDFWNNSNSEFGCIKFKQK